MDRTRRAVLMHSCSANRTLRRGDAYLTLDAWRARGGDVVFRIALRQPAARHGRSGDDGTWLGATVAPALLGAGLSLQSSQLKRVLRDIELLVRWPSHGGTDLAHFASRVDQIGTSGTGYALWIGAGSRSAAPLRRGHLRRLSGADHSGPHLDRFSDGESPAWYRRTNGPNRSDLQSPVAADRILPQALTNSSHRGDVRFRRAGALR